MKLLNEISVALKEGLGLKVIVDGDSIIFKSEADKRKAFKKLSKEGMTGLSKQTGLTVKFTDNVTVDKVLDIIEAI